MPSIPSKSQINALGERLRKDQHQTSDLELLDAYRSSFGDAQQRVVAALRMLGLEPTGRIAKTTPSIIGKLKRQSIRLTKIQDIAGCRTIVHNVAEQDRVTASIVAALRFTVIVDRREQPSHSYRAVHVVAEIDDKLVEIQVRTALQHTWAVLSEWLADSLDPAIKYGGGPPEIVKFLATTSDLFAGIESGRIAFADASDSARIVDQVFADLQAGLAPTLTGPLNEVIDRVALNREILNLTRRKEI